MGALGVIHGLTQGGGPDGIYGPWPVFIIVAAGLLAILAPEISARMAPFALLAFGAWGVYLVHFMRFDGYNGQLYYGVVHVAVRNRLVPASGATFQRALGGFAGTLTPVSSGVWDAWWNNGRLGLVLAEALAFLAAGVWLLALTRAPGCSSPRRR